MLVDLTPNLIEVERRKKICQEHGIEETFLCSHPSNHIEKGVYHSRSFGFMVEEFVEFSHCLSHGLSYEEEYLAMVSKWHEADGKKIPIKMISQYGVADNVEQIKEHYKDWIEKPDTKWVIAVTPVFQDKSNEGKGGGWRWHKWGNYIGKLNPQYEYLDDEDFGDDFQGYVLCYHIYPVR